MSNLIYKMQSEIIFDSDRTYVFPFDDRIIQINIDERGVIIIDESGLLISEPIHPKFIELKNPPRTIFISLLSVECVKLDNAIMHVVFDGPAPVLQKIIAKDTFIDYINYGLCPNLRVVELRKSAMLNEYNVCIANENFKRRYNIK